MNLYGLIVFHHVAAAGSVTRAAERLLISQPAVTAHVRNLGNELGLTLLAPKGRGIFLTEAGRRVAGHAARLFALEQDITRDIAAYRSGAAGSLRIAATSLPAGFLLPGWLTAFRSVWPDANVTMRTLNARDAMQELLHYDADLALIGGSREACPGLKRRLLLEDELWFIVAADHPLAGRTVNLSRMALEGFVMREQGSALRERLLALLEANGVSPPKTALSVNGLHETLHAVAAGFGAAFVSSLEAKPAVARREISRVYVKGEVQYNPIVLLTREGDSLTPLAQHFADIITGSTSHLVLGEPS
ncbi:LysR family transcriptional regulator [Paenibacillus sp. sptzw28]|uniref:LysR substrate-binding domain-containing protein n=1 Tax=Paenibacillus sp. sptzw28 TaxID=715179 RepID=UPI001C6E025C|nr:LysR family transcriptional regulator [Paenibacillus sp. sptzw28]QYR19662.1 LysR family transcriptional regulator [Paenibacillus sp. sptzw28]